MTGYEPAEWGRRMKSAAGIAFVIAVLLIAGRIDYDEATAHDCDANDPKAVVITDCPALATKLGYE